MDLHYVTFFQYVPATHGLPVVHAGAPDSGVLQVVCDLLVDLHREIAHRGSGMQGERLLGVGVMG